VGCGREGGKVGVLVSSSLSLSFHTLGFEYRFAAQYTLPPRFLLGKGRNYRMVMCREFTEVFEVSEPVICKASFFLLSRPIVVVLCFIEELYRV
jgi:hypothetical protein